MKFLTYCFVFLISIPLFSQKKDVLSNKEYHELQDKIKFSMNSNADSAFVFIARVENSNDPSHKAFALVSKSYLFQVEGKGAESNQEYKKAFEYLNQVPASMEKTKLNAYLLNIGGLIDWRKTDYSKALDKYKKGKKLSQSINDYVQIIKFNNNIALVNGDVGNFKQAISSSRESSKVIHQMEYLYTEEQLARDKGNIYLNLGNFYEHYYYRNKTNVQFLDSAEYFYEKTIIYSKDLIKRKATAETNLGNIYFEKKQFSKSEKVYLDMLRFTKENNLTSEYYNVNFNLGNLYFTSNSYDKALACFQKVDSIYALTKLGNGEFIKSNYYQAKIYNVKNDADKAYKYSKIYLDSFEKNELKLNNETVEVNYAIGLSGFKKEMDAIQKEYKNKNLIKNTTFILVGILFIMLLFVLFRNVKKRKNVEQKIDVLIAEHKINLERNKAELNSSPSLEELNLENKAKSISNLNIDEEKENEIVAKLMSLEKKLSYLNPDFTQQVVAKKIKTNTTYLSYVVNKRFGKSFGEYVYELKINYVINEIISNPTYRKYSTQAMAESVGYKNSVSFTKSFSKRTGVTPARFIKKLEDENHND